MLKYLKNETLNNSSEMGNEDKEATNSIFCKRKNRVLIIITAVICTLALASCGIFTEKNKDTR